MSSIIPILLRRIINKIAHSWSNRRFEDPDEYFILNYSVLIPDTYKKVKNVSGQTIVKSYSGMLKECKYQNFFFSF
jgi:hypothetical protein